MRVRNILCPRQRCEVILSAAEVLAKSTRTLGGVVVLSATFNDIRHCESFVGVQFENCTFSKYIRIAGSTFENCVFHNCIFSCDFFDCEFVNCKFVKCEFWQLSMTNILLESSEMSNCDFQYCHCWAVTGGVMADCAMFFCKFLCTGIELENCQLEYVSINDPD